ncbi:DUF6088 family protein [Noviherbaspirillum denitrificans]|nr:DUF6088 family protein [Noviherbaspirillum denitrificans]
MPFSNKKEPLPRVASCRPKEFLHLGSRAAVDQSFTRLVKAGKLMRFGRGTYVAPVESKFGLRAPAPEQEVASLAEKKGEAISPSGAVMANVFGLTTQVPVREVFLTSGRSRYMRLGSRQVEVRHAPRWQFVLGTSPAGRALHALAWLGKQHARVAAAKLQGQLPREEWQKLLNVRARCRRGWHWRLARRSSMADAYFSHSDTDRAEILAIGADTLDRPAPLLEKDIWVVWTLSKLFNTDLARHLTVKGGTSLSKA